MKPTSPVSSSTFLSISLCIGLVASLLLNIYQLYTHNEGWLRDAEPSYNAVEADQLQQQLVVCHREGNRKDSLISVLRHGTVANAYPTLSARRSP